MKRSFIFIHLFLLSVLCFAQQNVGIRVIGIIPDATDSNLYQMQVGAFRLFQNASSAFEKLKAASLSPSYEEYKDLTRVLLKGVKPHEVPSYIERIRKAGFPEVFIKIDPNSATVSQSPSKTDYPKDSYTSQSQIPPQNNDTESDFSEDEYSTIDW